MKNFKAPIIFTLLIITLSACGIFGGDIASKEIFTEQSVVLTNVDIGKAIWTVAPAPDGVYALSQNVSIGPPIFEYNLSFIDNTGVSKSTWLHKSESTADTREYYGVWYVGGKIITAYSPIDMRVENAPTGEYDPLRREVDLIFEEYDEDLNLARSVTVGKIPNSYTNSVTFDGEFFYYVSDDPSYHQNVGEPLADAVVYRLDRDLSPAGSDAPLGDERRMAHIEKVITGGDGNVYIVWEEPTTIFGNEYRMKKYGENEETISIGYNYSASFLPTGDSDYLFYMYHQNDEILGVSETGKVTKIRVRDPDPMYFIGDFSSSAIIDGVRVSFETAESGDTLDLVKKTFEVR
jgi:hypothetical protein